ncbi:hypothetical protein [Methanosphaerula palustris]|nr:hypothetical protein [Methanosphaerula palustris]
MPARPASSPGRSSSEARPATPLCSSHDTDRILALADGGHAGESCGGAVS